MMTADYKTGPLTRDRVAQAYPLVREIAGELTLESWSVFVRSMVARKSLADSLLEAVHELARGHRCKAIHASTAKLPITRVRP